MSTAVATVESKATLTRSPPFGEYLNHLWGQHQENPQDFSLNPTQIHIIREYLEKKVVPDRTTFGRVVDFLEGRLGKLDIGATIDWFNTDVNALSIKELRVSPRDYAQRLLDTKSIGEAILSFIS